MIIDDLRSALRSIWRSKLFALTALVAFSLRIGATTTVFSVIDAVLLRPPTFPGAKSVVTAESAEKSEEWGWIAPGIYDRIRSESGPFSEIAADRNAIFTVTRVPAPDQVFGFSVSGNYFAMLGAKPWHGRILQPRDDQPGAALVLQLSYRAWRS